MRAGDFRYNIVRPTLQRIELWSANAEELLMGTAAQESHLGEYVRQIGGPALGVYQCEPTTHSLVWKWVEKNRPALADKLRELIAPVDLIPGHTLDGQLVWNLAYATAIARVLYLSIPIPIPDSTNIQAQAIYWKRYYNRGGKGTPSEYVTNYDLYVKGRT